MTDHDTEFKNNGTTTAKRPSNRKLLEELEVITTITEPDPSGSGPPQSRRTGTGSRFTPTGMWS